MAVTEHSCLLFARTGRPTVQVLCTAAETVSRPFVGFFQQELCRRLQPSLDSGESVFFNHYLKMEGEDVKAHYLDLVFRRQKPNRRESSPVAVVRLDSGRIDWYKSHIPGSYIYQEIASRPEEFRALLEKAVLGMIGRQD